MDKYATVLLEILRKTIDKYRRQTLVVALFNLYYVFYIVFVKRINWCIVPHIIVQIDLPVDGVCTHSTKTKLAVKHEDMWNMSAVEANLPQQPLRGHFEERMFVILSSMAQSVGYNMRDNRVILGENYWTFTS